MKDVSPFTAADPAGLKLARSPVSAAIWQLLFPPVEPLKDFEAAAAFHGKIKDVWPMFSRGESRTINVGPDGPMMTSESVWLFQDPEGKWKASLASGAMVIETGVYGGRTEFLNRIDGLLSALAATARPSGVLRHGMRFVNRVPLPTGAAAAAAVFADGMFAAPAVSLSGASMPMHCAHEMAGQTVEGGRLMMRWGVMPPGGTHDPSLAPPLSVSSCFLDVDAFHDSGGVPRLFDPAVLSHEASGLASRCAAAFRWAVSDAFVAEMSVPAVSQQGVWRASASLH